MPDGFGMTVSMMPDFAFGRYILLMSDSFGTDNRSMPDSFGVGILTMPDVSLDVDVWSILNRLIGVGILYIPEVFFGVDIW
jgi:hypothetical protein